MSKLIVLLAMVIGGGSLALFGAFLFFGPLRLVDLGWSEAGVLAWDGLLSLAFFVQHSVMLRPAFRGRLTQVLAPHYHGVLFAIASGLVLTVVVVLWQTSTLWVYRLEGVWYWLARCGFVAVLAGMAWGAFALKSFDPLGLAAVRAHARGRKLPIPPLVIRGPYRWVRHPLYLFSILLLWLCPDVSADRLLMNLLWTTWIYVGTFLEEADLVAAFGEAYREYQREVPRLLPWRRRHGKR